MLRQRAWTVTLKVGIVAVQSPPEMLLNARTVHPLAELMKVSEMPLLPSPQTRLTKVPHPTGTVPAGHVVLTVVTQVPFAAGVQFGSVVLAVTMALPGPAGPCGDGGARRSGGSLRVLEAPGVHRARQVLARPVDLESLADPAPRPRLGPCGPKGPAGPWGP